MEGLVHKTLRIVVEEGDPCVIRWSGSIHSHNPKRYIYPYFESLVEKLPTDNVEVDFSEVEFMDSGSVSSIIFLCKLFNAKCIHTVIRFDRSVAWQASTFNALATLSRIMEYVSVDSFDGSADTQ